MGGGGGLVRPQGDGDVRPVRAVDGPVGCHQGVQIPRVPQGQDLTADAAGAHLIDPLAAAALIKADAPGPQAVLRRVSAGDGELRLGDNAGRSPVLLLQKGEDVSPQSAVSPGGGDAQVVQQDVAGVVRVGLETGVPQQ